MIRVCAMLQLRVKFNVDLSSSEIRRFCSIKFKKTYTHRQRKKKEELEKFTKGALKFSRNFPMNFQFAYCGSSDNSSAFIEKGKQRVNAES